MTYVSISVLASVVRDRPVRAGLDVEPLLFAWWSRWRWGVSRLNRPFLIDDGLGFPSISELLRWLAGPAKGALWRLSGPRAASAVFGERVVEVPNQDALWQVRAESRRSASGFCNFGHEREQPFVDQAMFRWAHGR